MTTLEMTHDEYHCQQCGDEIDNATVTGLLCSTCWLVGQELVA